jgi:hypothetical protein
VVLLFKHGDKLVEVIKNWLDAFQVVFLKSSKLLNGSEQFNELVHSSAEEVKSSEDLVWREIELLSLWHLHESLFGELVLLDISLVKLDAALQNLDELFAWILVMIPENIIVLWGSFLSSLTHLDSSEVKNVELAVGDHLIGDFSEKSSHSLVGVVISSDGMDHLDTVHQSWKSLFDRFWISFVKWLNEFLKSLKILNVILGFVQSLGNSKLNSSPF